MKRTVTIDGGSVSRKRSRTAISRSRPSVALQVKRILAKRVENKYIDNGATVVYVAGGYVNCINQSAEGSDFFQRIGRHITMKYLQVDILIQPSTLANATSNADSGFIAIVLDKQPNGTTPSFGSIFDSNNASPGNAFINVALDRNRYRVLKQEHYYCQPKFDSAGQLLGGSFQDILGMKRRWFVPLRDIDVEYNSASSAVPTHGALYIVWGSVLNNVAVGTGSITWTSRVAFSDM